MPEVRAVWQQIGGLAKQAGTQFPLPDAACAELRAQLGRRVLALYEGEVKAQAALLTSLS